VIRAGNIVTSRGIGLFEGVIVDSHFVARRRNNRLVSAVLEHPELVGVGIDEATAAWVKPDGTMEVVGDGWVLVYDATEAEVTRKPDGRMSVANMHEHALIAGQKYDLRSKKVIP
jgi:cyanophycinase